MSALDVANARLAATTRLPQARLETFDRANWTSSLLEELYVLAMGMAAEDRDHFLTHAHTNDAVHLFRERAGGALVGFQFWRSSPGPDAQRRVVIGGKLRILPAFRRRALHLLSGLVYYDAVMRANPAAQIHRLSIASVFGFVAIVGALSSYQFLSECSLSGPDAPPQERVLAPSDYWLCDFVETIAAESKYSFDRLSGVVDVHIRLTDAQLAGYPPEFYQRPLARAYLRRNPDFRTNGCYLAFGFTLSPENLASIHAEVERRLTSPARTGLK